MKVLRLGDSAFSADQYLSCSSDEMSDILQSGSSKTDVKHGRNGNGKDNSMMRTEKTYSVTLKPGDVLYHPAGMLIAMH